MSMPALLQVMMKVANSLIYRGNDVYKGPMLSFGNEEQKQRPTLSLQQASRVLFICCSASSNIY